MKKYPIGIQNFESLRREGYAYVDKTKQVLNLVDTGRYYFLSRPRRFGKSMLISTLEAYFLGKRELFEGLYIDSHTEEWNEHAVLHLDFNADKYDSADVLVSRLNKTIELWEKEYDSDGTGCSTAMRFERVIKAAHEKTGRGVVILVDEYDKPLLQSFDDKELQDAFRRELKAFYGVLKSSDAHIKFALFTGVTKFSKVSVFSDLNNLRDISLLKHYADICGLTEQELHDNFDEDIMLLAEDNDMTKDECYAKLKKMYDGYKFSEAEVPGMYNPFSILNTLASLQFRSYWFETGTPTILVEYLKKTNYNLDNLTTEGITADTLNSIDIMDTNPVPLIYQSGYLTIKSYDKRFEEYILGFPNQEVEEGFMKFLSKYYVPAEKSGNQFSITQFVKDIERGKAEQFMQRLDTLFANGNYKIVGDTELYFHNSLYVFFKLMGLYVDVERHTTDGRMDMLVQTTDYIYIIEIKLNQSADIALQQIEDKQYAKPFAMDARKLYKIGINFSTDTRRIDDWKIVG